MEECIMKERHCSAFCSITSVTPAGAIILLVTASSCQFLPSKKATVSSREWGRKKKEAKGRWDTQSSYGEKLRDLTSLCRNGLLLPKAQNIWGGRQVSKLAVTDGDLKRGKKRRKKLEVTRGRTPKDICWIERLEACLFSIADEEAHLRPFTTSSSFYYILFKD